MSVTLTVGELQVCSANVASHTRDIISSIQQPTHSTTAEARHAVYECGTAVDLPDDHQGDEKNHEHSKIIHTLGGVMDGDDDDG